MNIIKEREFKNGINFRNHFSYSMVKKLMSSCTQFIIDLSIKVKISYSISSLAIHLCHYFFHKKSYENFDRFIVCAASLFLSCKIFDTPIRISQISSAYIKLRREVDNKGQDIIDNRHVEETGEKICEAESDIIKVIDYKLKFEVPYRTVDVLFNQYIEEPKDVYWVSRMFVLDMYRAGASLLYDNMTIALASVILSLQVSTGDIVPQKVTRLYELEYKQHLESMMDAEQNNDPSTAHEKKMSWMFERWVSSIQPQVRLYEVNKVIELLQQLLGKVYLIEPGNSESQSEHNTQTPTDPIQISS